MQKLGMTRKIEKVFFEIQSGTYEDTQKFLESWKELNPKVYEVIIE